MSKKITVAITLVVLLAIGLLTAAESERAARTRRTEGQQGRAGASRRRYSRPDPLSAEAEKKIMDVLDDLGENQRRGNMNVPLEDGQLLRMLVRSARARRVVEIGTSNGYSGIWICLALKSTGGRLITHEIDEGRAKLARENFKRAGVDDIVTLAEGDAHETIKKLEGSIDILFLDADKSGYMDYMEKLLPLVRPGGLILAHNTTNAGSDMQDYLKLVTTSPNLQTLFLHKDGRGMGATLKIR
ncbi:MAG: O-methyltransferase [Planctomycetota bacterium]|jgi:predicted O-methyltransferase YrrM